MLTCLRMFRIRVKVEVEVKVKVKVRIRVRVRVRVIFTSRCRIRDPIGSKCTSNPNPN